MEDEDDEDCPERPFDEDNPQPAGSVNPNDIRERLLEERRKNFAKKWHSKYN